MPLPVLSGAKVMLEELDSSLDAVEVVVSDLLPTLVFEAQDVLGEGRLPREGLDGKDGCHNQASP